MKKLILSLCVLMLSGCRQYKKLIGIDEDSSSSNISSTNWKLIAMVGQSGMSGRGRETPSYGTDPRIRLFSNGGEWRIASDPLDDATGETGPAIDNIKNQDGTAGVGPGMAFAYELLRQNPNLHIGLIPCAKGGTGIVEWQEGQPLFENCVERIKEAERVTGGTLAGMIGHQGELDAGNTAISEPDRWTELFSAMVRAFRNRLNKQNLPVGFVQLTDLLDPTIQPYKMKLRDQQAAVNLPYVYMADDRGLMPYDGVHLNTAGVEEEGRRLGIVLGPAIIQRRVM